MSPPSRFSLRRVEQNDPELFQVLLRRRFAPSITMSAISNFAASPLSQGAVHFPDRKLKFESVFGVNLRISRSYEVKIFSIAVLRIQISSLVAG